MSTGKKISTHPILVIGGGISGITTAVEAAETGFNVILIEKLPYLGGRVIRMNEYFPKLCPPICGLEINFRRIRQNPKIKVLTKTIVEEISGKEGDYKVKIKTGPFLINDNCTACGECEKVCPVTRSSDFDYGMLNTKAVYLPNELAFPFKYDIDEKACLKETCKKCLDVCKYEAIQLNVTSTEKEICASSIIVATGGKPYDPELLTEYKFGLSKDIITNVMMERLGAPNGPTNGRILCPSCGEMPHKIAFIQCAGSRDENHLDYCSGVCCSASFKQALYFNAQNPEGKIIIFYVDLRVSGRNEDMLKKVQENKHITLIKGKVGQVTLNKKSGKPIIKAEDITSGTIIEEEFDLIVLATGIIPENPFNRIRNNSKYYCIDIDYSNKGLLFTGCAKKPMDVATSLKDATGVVLKAIQMIRDPE